VLTAKTKSMNNMLNGISSVKHAVNFKKQDVKSNNVERLHQTVYLLDMINWHIKLKTDVEKNQNIDNIRHFMNSSYHHRQGRSLSSLSEFWDIKKMCMS